MELKYRIYAIDASSIFGQNGIVYRPVSILLPAQVQPFAMSLNLGVSSGLEFYSAEGCPPYWTKYITENGSRCTIINYTSDKSTVIAGYIAGTLNQYLQANRIRVLEIRTKITEIITALIGLLLVLPSIRKRLDKRVNKLISQNKIITYSLIAFVVILVLIYIFII